MVAEIAIHFEGSSGLRPGFHKLFERHVRRARRQRFRFKLIAGGSRTETVKGFLWSCAAWPTVLNVLLIDSEAPVAHAASMIRTLRNESFWDRDVDCGDDQIHLMVQAIEAWFVADQQAFIKYFGRDFNSNALPSPQNAESTSPNELMAAIRNGLRRTQRRRDYDKVSDGLKLLQLIDEDTVSQNCQHFRRLIAFLDQAL